MRNFHRSSSMSAPPYPPHPIYTISGNSGKHPPHLPELPEIPKANPPQSPQKSGEEQPAALPAYYTAADKYIEQPSGGITKARLAARHRHLQFPEIAGNACGNCGDLAYNNCSKLKQAGYIEHISNRGITCKNTQCFLSKKLPKL